MYIPFTFFAAGTCLYYIAKSGFSGPNNFNYTDCNNITQSAVLNTDELGYYTVNSTYPTTINGLFSGIQNTELNAPIQNLPLINNYYQIVTSKNSTNSTNIMQGNLFVPWYSGSVAFDYFSINSTSDGPGLNSKTYITTYPQFTSFYDTEYTIFPLEDASYVTTTIDYLIVAGGGAGGANTGTGGGGAGGLLSGSLLVSSSTDKTIIYVGAGGQISGSNGKNSTLTYGGNNTIYTAIGGGAGNTTSGSAGSNGGSGGGSGTGITGSGTIGQGNNGGAGINREAGGGGGASQRGGSGSNDISAGNGGSGSQWLDGNWYAGGGGGGTDGYYTTVGIGGIGGGGDGGKYLFLTSSDGQPNTGGGAGGGGIDLRNGTGKKGGSGIVKLRYQGPRRAIGGDYTYYDNGYTYHVYTTTSVSSSFQFMGGKYVNKNYSTLPTSSLAITSSLFCLIDAEYTESFVDFDNKLIYDSTANSNNVFNQLNGAYSYVTSSTFPYIQFIGTGSANDEFNSNTKDAILRFNNVSSTTPITDITLVSVYNIPKLTSTINDPFDNIPILGDYEAQRASLGNGSQFDPFGIFLSGSSTNLYSVVLKQHNDNIVLPFSSSINGWHITQMSYNSSTNIITWANDNITGSTIVSDEDWYRFTFQIQQTQNFSSPYYFETGSKFKLSAIYTSSLSANQLVQNYNFISQSLI